MQGLEIHEPYVINSIVSAYLRTLIIIILQVMTLSDTYYVLSQT